MTQNKTIILGISGASGAIYAQRLLEILADAHCHIHLIITPTAQRIIADELNISEPIADNLIKHPSDNITFHNNDNLFDSLASGSCKIDAMVICPCSSHSIASIATGLANTLLLRSAYVTLKQSRKLILVHRETPLTQIDLENMLRISRAGGIICPANPPFYMHPKTTADLVDSIVGRIIDLLDIDHKLPIRWSP